MGKVRWSFRGRLQPTGAMELVEGGTTRTLALDLPTGLQGPSGRVRPGSALLSHPGTV
jgi:hypothetical protein